MHILGFRARNTKRIQVVDITPKDWVVPITGPNDSGKSTALDCIGWALEGKRSMDAKPLRNGADEGEIELKIGDEDGLRLIVKRVVKADGETELFVYGPEGAPYRKGQQVLETFFNTVSLDVGKFIAMKPEEKAKTLGDMLGLTQPLAELEEERKRLYDERTEVGRELKRVTAAADSVRVHDEAAQSVDVAELLERIEQERVERFEDDKARDDAAQAQAQLTTVDEKLEKLRAMLEEGEARRAALVTSLDVKRMKAAERDRRKREDMDAMRTQLQDAESINADVRARTERDKLRYQAEERRAEQDALTVAIEHLAEQKAKLVREADMPVEGLSIEPDGLVLNGAPFEQASTAQKYETSMAIGMRFNPALRVVRIQNAALMDRHTRERVYATCRAKKWQVWLELADADATDGFILEDGLVREPITLPAGEE